MIGYRFWISAGTFLIVPDHLLNHFFDFLRYFIFPDRGGIGQFEWKKACTSRLNHDSTKFFYLLCLLMVDVLLCVCNALLSVVVLRSLPWDQIPSWNWSSTPFQPFQPFQPFTHCPFSRHLSERERGRGWEVLICFDNFGKIMTYSNISNSCCIMLYPIWSFLQWGSWPSTTSPARKSADFWAMVLSFDSFLVRCWSDVGNCW